MGYKIEAVYQNRQWEILLNGRVVDVAANSIDADRIVAKIEREERASMALAADINAAPPRQYEH